MKICNKCGVEKAKEEFHKDKAYKCGYRSICKTCCLAAAVLHRSKPEVKERHRAYQQQRLQTHGDLVRKQVSESAKRNRKRITAHIKTKMTKDSKYYLSRYYTDRINSLLFNKTGKSKYLKYLGCTPSEWRQWLSVKFSEGMTWETYGKSGWNIDHIIPIASFDLSDEEEVYKAFHYTNTQPLWASENSRKSNKVID